MKKRQLSATWGLLASAGIFFIFGRFIAPEYEAKLLEFGVFDEVFPVSKYSLMLSGVLDGNFSDFYSDSADSRPWVAPPPSQWSELLRMISCVVEKK